MYKITKKDFAISFGVNESDIIDKCSELIKNYNFSYRPIINKDRDELIMKILKRIEEDTQVIGHPNRKNIWQKGWKENLDKFIGGGSDESSLVPKFIRPLQPIRLRQKYIMPEDPQFELNYFNVYRNWLFKSYFAEIQNCYEFGCGTGFNLYELGKLFPEIELWGSDFVQSSVDLVNAVSKKYQSKLNAYLFDMINPDLDKVIKPNSGVFTIGAIEQLAGKFHSFIDYLIENRPKVVIHTEPMIELYDTSVLEDYLAYKYQHQRGYSEGLLPYLKELDNAGKIRIEKIQRLNFGSLYMEGYNLIVWRPV